MLAVERLLEGFQIVSVLNSSVIKGFTPDVKIWEVAFDKTDNFKEIRRAFELKGHSAGVYAFSYNSDSTRQVNFIRIL